MQDGAAALSRLARLAGGDEPLAVEVLVALQDPQRYLAEHRDRLMGLVDTSLAPVGFSLVALDIRSDGYPVVLLPAAEADAAAELAGTAGLGQVLRFGT